MTIQTKRVYAAPAAGDGARWLVDRLWPRGLMKAAARLDGWAKDVAPSEHLRRWFSHDPRKWGGFRRRYFAELEQNPSAWRPILDAAARDTVTLLFGANDEQHNNAVALREYLEAQSGGPAAHRASGPKKAPQIKLSERCQT